MTKKQLRKIYLDKRSALSVEELNRLHDLLLIMFQRLPLGNIKSVLSYWPIQEKREVNTNLMVDYLAFLIPELQLAFPVMNPDGNVFNAVIVDDNTQYARNDYGIAQPTSGDEMPADRIDLILVPLLAYDASGFRVGYGKGFYDRFLSHCRNDVFKVGFSYFEPDAAIDDIDEFDVPLSVCVTPNKIYEF